MHPSERLEVLASQTADALLVKHRAAMEEFYEALAERMGSPDATIDPRKAQELRDFIRRTVPAYRPTLLGFVREAVEAASARGLQDLRVELVSLGFQEEVSSPRRGSKERGPLRDKSFTRWSRDLQARMNKILHEADSGKAEVVHAELVRAGERTEWRIRRLAETEAMDAYNAAREDVLSRMGGYPRLRLRWVERIDDRTGLPLDARVAPDSFAMHGLQTRPGQPFTIPNDRRIDPKLRGRKVRHPPLRPHDRAVVEPVLATRPRSS